MQKTIVAVIAFDRISAFHLSVPCVVFGEAFTGTPPLEVLVCTAEAGPWKTTAGFGLLIEYDLRLLDTAQIIVVPSWRDPNEKPPQALLEALRKAYRRGARIVGLCLGAYVLAEAGLLDGRRASTHWAYAEDFAARYPAVRVDADVLYVDEDNIVTSAGTVAGIDCCLHLLRQQFGAEAANSAARRLVTAPHRLGGQAQFIEQPLPATPRDSRLAELLDWVRQNLHQEHPIDSLAAKIHMSRRTFTRHFRQLTGSTVGAWLLGERLAFSQRLLETTEHSVDAVAALAGFGSPESFRLHFRKAFGVSPRAWRQLFKGDA